jgi:hypothetical protein
MAVNIREALMTYLLAQSALTTLVGRRIRYDERDQEDALPAVGIIDVSNVFLHTHEGQIEVEMPVMQVTAYATTRAGSIVISELVKTALQDYQGSMSGLVVQKIELQSENTGLITTPDGVVRVYATDLELEITYEKE